MSGIVLFGPPTAGKDTISTRLTEHDKRFRQLVKVKVGSGRTTGYRVVGRAELEALRAADRVVLETERYGNIYAIDRADLELMHAAGHVPIVHLGSIAHLRMFRAAVREPWLCVLLWVPREVCGQRSTGRGDRDTSDRLAAWDAARSDLAAAPRDESLFHLMLRTDRLSAEAAAGMVARAYASPPWKYPEAALSEFVDEDCSVSH
ncbi:guanylate kinase [Streptomyces sp. NPDC059175]|uniref:guanylate kinase n=1 Tax=Streptomyces sp. NPDC059175 TaxID=3346757 RepID=UPI0036C36AFC